MIDKIYLTWLDVNKLLATFPEHVKLVCDDVIFKGPVAIVSPMSLTKRHLIQCSYAIIAGVVSYIYMNFYFWAYAKFRAGGARNSFTYTRIVVPLIGGLAMGALCYYMAGRSLPTQAGVYFGNQPPFHA